jgi:hypothetical protein
MSGAVLSNRMLYVESKVRRIKSHLESSNMSRINKLPPKLRKAPQPPLSHTGASADADRAIRPPLAQPSAPDSGTGEINW